MCVEANTDVLFIISIWPVGSHQEAFCLETSPQYIAENGEFKQHVAVKYLLGWFSCVCEKSDLLHPLSSALLSSFIRDQYAFTQVKVLSYIFYSGFSSDFIFSYECMRQNEWFF